MSLCTVLALVGGMIVAAAAPALAQPDDVQLFMPEGSLNDKDQLSDMYDGVDELAHLTAVAGEDTVTVLFFFCEPGTAAETFDNDDCVQVGEDDDGALDPRAGSDTDDDDQEELAFEAFYDIGSDGEFEDEEVDVVAVACETDATQEDVDDSDFFDDECVEDREAGIFVDDSDNSDTEIPAGEIIGFCAPDYLPYGVYADKVDSEQCDDPANYQDLPHGGVLPNIGSFAVLFRTSEDVTDPSGGGDPELAVGACLDQEADYTQEPTTCDTFWSNITDTGGAAGDTAGYNEFIASFDDIYGESDGDVAIWGNTEEFDTGGECPSGSTAAFASTPEAGDTCVFDEHYFQSLDEEATTIGATFDPQNNRVPEGDPDTGQEQGRTAEDRDFSQANPCANADTEESNEVGDIEAIIACVYDQFGRKSSESAVLFVSEGVGGFIDESCEGYTADTDSDGQTDICSEDTTDYDGENAGSDPGQVTEPGEADVTGTASVDITEPEEAGTQTITACLDDEDNGDPEDDDEQTETACASGVASVTLTKTWGGGAASQVDLVFDDGSGTCTGNREFRQNQIGDTDTLHVCTYDEFGNPAGTDSFGEDLDWDIENPNVVSFTDQAGNPPTDTDTSGNGEATIRANAAGSTDITVCVGSGDCDSVTKTVGSEPPPPGARPECSDGVDNDGDGTVDTADTDCTGPNDTSENPSGQAFPLCSNNADDDGDGKTDGQDPGCSGPNDGSESPDPQPPARTNTNITIRWDESGHAFKGSVGSNRKGCSRFRKVVLKKVKPGPNRTVGRDTSNRAGNWSVRKRRAHGNYYAVAKRKRYTNRFGRLIICLRDKSPTINV